MLQNCNLSFEAVSKTMYIVEDILKITPRMRSILQYWIKQACRVELFKQSQSDQHALHSKFHLHTGEEIYSHDFYNHLQIDLVPLDIIFLVQMITSGLQIIYMQNEVAFIQTLVYYVERTYRMPD
uniref:Phosphorylase b kinase regulatory subunit n=1 Tax=Glossina palpalis gambiensis TaxID=67801 RepID=A0A1B0AU26_9MUSC